MAEGGGKVGVRNRLHAHNFTKRLDHQRRRVRLQGKLKSRYYYFNSESCGAVSEIRHDEQCCGSGSSQIRTFWSDPDPVKFSGFGSGSTIKSHIRRNKSYKLNRYHNFVKNLGTFLK